MLFFYPEPNFIRQEIVCFILSQFITLSFVCFYSSVTLEQCRTDGAMLAFTVMDHDVLTANDFAGEAFLSLGSIPGVTSAGSSDNFHGLKHVELCLMHQKNKSKCFRGNKLAKDVHVIQISRFSLLCLLHYNRKLKLVKTYVMDTSQL